ncbi:hypothetical protein Rumeso_01275 [Rubellimicrobium mesophilum DSM 19309]|uniref:Uncharacterized protein n=1 Tax=Rubellimicrobium mesophilum DSM 19309 TaxID=442562 RepID=A0A017HSP2_9RHOB|nr:hypothetical protein [Rubellimicrobium mesophilum]EYD77163.1 hypothetical protein Rumeso_01275 [Rubellimicrobium mesophilum DSM 19309]
MTRRAPPLRAPLAGLLAGALLAASASAEINPYPPSYCAALWEGYADVLGDRGERALAARFREVSVRRIGEAETDAQIAERRPWMVDLMNAYIYHQDDQSRRLFERLVRGCGDLAGDLSLNAPRD